MKKKIIIMLLIIIIAVIFLVKTISNNKFNYSIEEIKNLNYYIYKQNDQYGIINKNGETIINAQYTNIIIPNPEKDVFICYNNDDAKVLNASNEEIFTSYETVEPIKLKNVASALNYEKSVLIYKQDGLYGLIDYNGKTITKNIYSTIENLKPTEGKFLVTSNEKYGVIDLKGNILVDTKYDQIISDGYYEEEEEYKKSGFIVANKTEEGIKYGYIDNTGKQILETKYNEIERISKEDIYLIVSEDGQYGLYNKSKNIIENQYQSITYAEDTEVLIIRKNKNYGVATLDGKIIVNTENDKITPKGIYLYAQVGNDKKVYDNKGNIIEINYDKSIYKTENSEYFITTILNNNITYYGIADKNFNQLIGENYRYIEYLYQDYFIATNEEGKLGVINSNGKTILDMKYSSLQKIKGKNIIQAIEEQSEISEIYSQKMENVSSMSKANIQTEDEYIIIYNETEKIYLDNNGNKIEDISSLQQTAFPDKIGEYEKEQITIENIYYVIKSENV